MVPGRLEGRLRRLERPGAGGADRPARSRLRDHAAPRGDRPPPSVLLPDHNGPFLSVLVGETVIPSRVLRPRILPFPFLLPFLLLLPHHRYVPLSFLFSISFPLVLFIFICFFIFKYFLYLQTKKLTLNKLKKITTPKAILSSQLRLNYGSCFHRRSVKKLIKPISRRC